MVHRQLDHTGLPGPLLHGDGQTLGICTEAGMSKLFPSFKSEECVKGECQTRKERH